MEQIVNFIKNVKDADFNAANSIFNELMSSKVNGLMDAEKVKIADQVFNGADPDEDPVIDDVEEEDLEDDADPDIEDDEEVTEDDIPEEEEDEDPVEETEEEDDTDEDVSPTT